ncbi:P-loop containing nucleoside triphosphate hydrolase protein [Fusarium flagelliforme]|uniref:P-loop containing nucleoside triphosphate hydrolase protein n=1 Tax=Fusarium flagelliforme TaxID=2675880 RepID=UPI001E8EB7E0|nr:P-loop containing nucleoside triphosphate hydrolase protein [Fusarium flagelliforme]KAH7186175.1 P-loop containing nucleoside triphosphate hydrolase protein [Fusarium flagelliforme]
MDTSIPDTNMARGDYRALLDIIDNLRLHGVSRYIDLPEIIVCGDQSAGKSSVLEAISGMSFPIKDGRCTRFATELVLRRGHKTDAEVSITPGKNRFGEDKERLETWRPNESLANVGLGVITKEAESAMAIPGGTGEFYEDTLRIELTGPDQPHLTMVDLPGLFRGGNKEQSDTDIDIVHDMVASYMVRPRSIILAVVSAKYEYVLQEVTKMAKNADPNGLRTMGLITKPDTLDVGSPSEDYFVRLAKNVEEELRLGWHVLKNRDFKERDVTSAQRDEIERAFFSQGLWDSVDSLHCGVAALRVRLSIVLKDQILAQLPSLEQDVEEGIRDCAERLDYLGPVRGTPQQQQSYLLRVSEEYTSLMRHAVDGTYTDQFFGSRNDKATFNRRLRAVQIVDSESDDEGDIGCHDVPEISRSDFINEVADRLVYGKGRELPGLFNPLIVNDLFVEQCTPWKKIVMSHAEDILEAVEVTTELIVGQTTASEVSKGVLKYIRKEINELETKMIAQINTLLESAAQYPITNNSQLTRNVQRIQQKRHKRNTIARINDMFGQNRFDGSDKKISINPLELLKVFQEGFEPNMERFGSALAVAMDRFIDDVSVLAVEDCLISKLPGLFRSANVMKMGDEDLDLLAGETSESSMERERLKVKLEILEKGLQDIKGFHKRRAVIDLTQHDDIAWEYPEKKPASSPEQASDISSSAKADSDIFSTEDLAEVREQTARLRHLLGGSGTDM